MTRPGWARILKILHYYSRVIQAAGGPYTGIIGLAQLLSERGHETTIASREIEEDLWSMAAVTPSIECMVLDSQAWLKGASSRTGNFLEGVDIVHIHGMWSPSASAVAELANMAGVPYVVSLRGMMREWAMRQKRWKKVPYWHIAGRRLLRNAALVHVTAHAELLEAQDWAADLTYELIPNYFDVRSFFPPTLGRSDERPKRLRICSLGRLHPSKGVDGLLKAVSLLPRDARAGVEIAIAGKGKAEYERDLRDLASSLGLQNTVQWLGPVFGSDKALLLHGCDVLVSLSSTENFGFSLFEALAAGTHVITTPAVATADCLVASGNATLVEDEEELAVVLARRLQEGFSEEARLAGIEYVSELLDPVRIGERWEEVLSNAASIPAEG